MASRAQERTHGVVRHHGISSTGQHEVGGVVLEYSNPRRTRRGAGASAALIVVGSRTWAFGGVVPASQQLEREDAGGVSIIPGDGESPSAVERSVLDA